jgi:release factor glutamine methyltransferase
VTLRDAIAAAAARLGQAGVDTPRLDAELLLLHVAQRDRAWLVGHRDDPADAALLAAFEPLVQRRLAREPVSRIMGEREFWSLPFRLAPDTLDPRPDTETLVELVLELAGERGRAWRILDLGTGSGCILLALLSELPQAHGTGVDIAPGAVAAARFNAERLGLAARAQFAVSSWGAAVQGPFDLVVSNPPYIASGEIATLAPEVARFDPLRALDGGADGLDAYRAIASESQRLLAPGGIIAVETGMGQGDDVARIFSAMGLREIARKRDLAGLERVVAAHKVP